MEATWVPETCTLPTAERPVREAELASLFGAAVRGVDRVGAGRLRLELDPSPEVAGRTARLMAKETSCCSFFSFTLTADGAGLRLDVAAPEARSDVLDALAVLAAGATR